MCWGGQQAAVPGTPREMQMSEQTLRAVACLRSQQSFTRSGAVGRSGSRCSTEGQRDVPGVGAFSSSAGCTNLLSVDEVGQFLSKAAIGSS